MVKQLFVFDSLSALETNVERCSNSDLTMSQDSRSKAANSPNTKNAKSQTENLEEAVHDKACSQIGGGLLSTEDEIEINTSQSNWKNGLGACRREPIGSTMVIERYFDDTANFAVSKERIQRGQPPFKENKTDMILVVEYTSTELSGGPRREQEGSPQILTLSVKI
ncbi:hypothetical protein HELRODRAFT_174309 [Helobdella robusta]|uniref:Uncharacterized protein n=1 Tax=Helobdella robusta TaxID=6412 RepID=T1F7Z5_HELRO|nr:hypothetical protein HELRODRAFT_174309 [Helobdella robusta]ESO02873.1 hypothetical protein HELRODRAFT_174309 [Helobdella robusta]